jgi:hypothetical protein
MRYVWICLWVFLSSACGSASDNLNNVQFYQHGAPQELIAGRLAGMGHPTVFGSDELSTSLTDRSLEDGQAQPRVDAVFLTKNERVEVDLFSRDPSELTATFDGALKSMLTDHDKWLTLTQMPGAIPKVLVLPRGAATIDNKLPLTTKHFFGGQTPQAPGNAPSGKGSIKAAIVYDHGQCSRNTSTKDLLRQVSDGVWAGFLEKFNKGTWGNPPQPICNGEAHAFRKHSRTLAWLREDDQQALRGGFFLSLHYFIHIFSWLAADIDAFFLMKYRWKLDKGVLAVSADIDPWYNVEGYDASSVKDQFTEALKNELPKRLGARSLDQQTVDVFKPGSLTGRVHCRPKDASPCRDATNWFALAIMGGAQRLRSEGKVDLSNAEMTSLAIAANGADGNGKANWRCVPDDPDVVSDDLDKNHCEFVARAKRLNVYPDRLELVWFDGKETSNPAYALWVAAHAAEDDAGVKELCSVKVPDDVKTRSYASDLAPLEDSQSDCVIVEATGGGGCNTSSRGALGLVGVVVVLLLAARLRARRARGLARS